MSDTNRTKPRKHKKCVGWDGVRLLPEEYGEPAGVPLPAHLIRLLGSWVEPRWWQQARCVGSCPDEFFPSLHAGPEPAVRRICGSCEVRSSCLATALANDEYGVWGGITRAERNQARSRLRDGDDPGLVFGSLLDGSALPGSARRLLVQHNQNGQLPESA